VAVLLVLASSVPRPSKSSEQWRGSARDSRLQTIVQTFRECHRQMATPIVDEFLRDGCVWRSGRELP